MNPTRPVTPIAGASTALPPLPVTPLRELRSYTGVWLKCEHENPTGSHKDRAYWSMIAPRAASLSGRTLIDYTSGNGGISLAWFARELGLPAVVFMPEGMTQQRIDRIRSYGAELILTPQAGFIAAARAAAEAYAAQNPEVELLSQSDNADNEGGFNVVGEEIVKQCAAIGLRPAAFVCAIGTGASFS
jgi:cysteine synthase